MIRRWSRIIFINKTPTISQKIYFRFFFVNFKRSIIFKKYKIKSTRFTRKALVKAKHKGNWTIYLQIFKSWVIDFKFVKSYTKYQIFNESFLFNFLSYDFYHLNLKQFNTYETRFFLVNHLTKQMKSFFVSFKKNWDFKNAPTNTTSFIEAKTMLYFDVPKPTIFPLYIKIDSTFLFINIKSTDESFAKGFKFSNILNQYDNLIYKKINEFYKIFNLLWCETLR